MDAQLEQLIINELTKEQYEELTPTANQLYLVTDENPLDSSDIETTISSSSTNEKVAGAKAVYDYHDITKYDSSNPNGYTDNTGTVTSVSVSMNGVTKGTVTTSGDIDLGTVLTEHQTLSDLGITASATELNYSDGVTSNIQTQLNGKQATIPANTYDSYGSASAVQGNLDTHTGNTTVHITSSERTSWNNKVDKVSGKGLSTNDYDNTEKGKVASAIQPNDNITELTNNAGYITQAQVPTELYWCTYGTTTSSEIATSINNGKLLVANYEGITYTYYGIASSRYVFTGVGQTASKCLLCKISDSTWSTTSASFEKTSNKVTSITSSSTDTEYPSAKLLYDQLQLKQDTIPANTYDTYGSASVVQSNLDTHTGDTTVHTTSQEKATWNGKQDTISDLSTIRTGAGLGATAVQPNAISDMATQTWVGQQGFITSSAITGKEDRSNKVTSLSASSTDTEYPSAKCVYDIIGNVESLLSGI